MDYHLSHLNSIDMLLGSIPSRKQILNAPKLPVHRSFKIRVIRNFPFEFVQHIMPPFFALWGSDFTVELSEYDAALSHVADDQDADAYIIWLDWRLYHKAMSEEDAAEWLQKRIYSLRSKKNAPILVNNWPENMETGEVLFSPRAGNRGWTRKLNACLSHAMDAVPDCWIVDLAHLSHEIHEPFLDSRNDEISHYPFSNRATIAIARHIGIHLFPALFLPRIKAIALDLDDTLYTGTLGEDGIDGIRLNDDHLHLQHILLRLKQSGILLTLCTRNEEKDVKALFERRSDFALKWKDFAAVCANWLPKPDNLITLARKLNFDPSAFLFIDDNSAELLKMGDHLPSVGLLRANPDGRETVRRICNYPGLYQLRVDDTAHLRTADIQANEIREGLKTTSGNYHSYLEALQMKIRMYQNYIPHTKRLYELSRKTNQFNLALRRISEAEADQFMQNDDYLIITVQLTDTLTDSGIIGAFVCHLEDGKTRLLETLFSCRALGREIETVSFAFLLECLYRRGVKLLDISVAEGPRNSPAREWLSRFVQGEPIHIEMKDLLPLVKAACSNHPAKVEEMQ